MSEVLLPAEPGAPGTRGVAARSPLMEQYARIKRDHAEAFLFFRLGDFYEMFFEDAVRGAQLLGLTPTSRNKQEQDSHKKQQAAPQYMGDMKVTACNLWISR